MYFMYAFFFLRDAVLFCVVYCLPISVNYHHNPLCMMVTQHKIIVKKLNNTVSN